jgi:hypothetical protein
VADSAQPLRAVVGDRVRAVRETANVRQQVLSDAARALGLTTWTRTRIAALERGDKAISAEDLVRLLAVLTLGLRRTVDLTELFDSPRRIGLSDVASIEARRVVDVFRGGNAAKYVAVSRRTPPLDTPERAAAAARAGVILHAAGRKRLLTVGEQRAVTVGLGEADERAARKLGEAPYPFETLCAVLWGRSLSEERDARLAAAGADLGTTAASLAARRGRVTRELLAEAAALLARADELQGGDDGDEHRETT